MVQISLFLSVIKKSTATLSVFFCGWFLISELCINKSTKMAYKKIDKEFCLTDDSVNVYGYRLITSGLQIDRFKPAIGFLMHDRDKGVAVRWEDFRTEVGKLFAKPVVNESLFPDLAKQIEDGFYAAASVGHIVALETSDDPADRLEGQTSVTVKKWFPRECSIVDIPGNYNALAQLYDEGDGVLHDLSDNYKPDGTVPPIIQNNMDKNVITVADLKLPNLSADATAEQINAAIADLSAKAERSTSLEKELNDLKAAHTKERVAAIVKAGMEVRKLTKELADKLEKDYAANPEGLQALVDSLPAQTMLAAQMTDGVPEKYQGKTFNDLYLSGDWEEVKTKYPDLAKTLKS